MSSKFLFLFAFFALIIAPVSASAETIARGSLKGVSVKWSSGSVSLVKNQQGLEIRLGSNFKTKRGPSLWVYLGNDKPEKRIGKLKATEGAQAYSVPARVDVRKYTKVFIYCVPFNAVFASGRLR